MPATRTPQDLRREILDGKLLPLYLLLGSDEAEKTSLADEIIEVLDKDLRVFNLDRFYGAEVSPQALVDTARTLPMGTDRRVVVVSQAEKLIEPKRSGESLTKALSSLSDYVMSPEPLTSVVLIAGALDRRRKLTTLLMKKAAVVDCAGVEGTAEVKEWVRDQFSKTGLSITSKALRALIDRAGDEIGRLRSDVERVALYAAGRDCVEETDVLAVVGSVTSQDDWAVTRAIERRATSEALKELAMALDAGAAPQMVLGQLGWFVRTRLRPARAAGAIGALFRTDLAMKSSGGDVRILLERLVVELCENQSVKR